MLYSEEKEKLKNIFASYSVIRVAYLFGSYAKNKEGELSDIDLGVLLLDNYDKIIKLDIMSDLAENSFCDVDLVILNEADLLTQFEIVKHNKIIYQDKDFDAANYFSKTIRKFLDFRPFLAVQREYFKERLLNG
jgi:hypothetical protein